MLCSIFFKSDVKAWIVGLNNMTDQLLYDQYAATTQKYKAIYGGETTVVLMQVGSFLEFYDCDKRLGANVPLICGILGIQATRKSKTIPEVSRKNPAMGGVPADKSHKFVTLLLNAGWTVVMLMQKQNESGQISREVTEVLSVSTCAASVFLNGSSSGASDANVLMAMHVEAVTVKNANANANAPAPLSCGWAIVDLVTGRTRAGESNNGSALDCLRRIVVAHRPSEAVIIREGEACPSVESIGSHVGMRRRFIHERPSKQSPTHQNEVLKKAYPSTGFLTPAEFVNLERMPSAIQALVAAIEFAHDHNPAVVSRIHVPEVIDSAVNESIRVDIGPDTVHQLDVIPTAAAVNMSNDPVATLMGVLNRCKTASGKRAFKERVLNPIHDVGVIEKRYDAIDRCMRLQEAAAHKVLSHLGSIGDIERVFRRVVNLKRFGKVQEDLLAIADWMKNAEAAFEASSESATAVNPHPHPARAAIESRLESQSNAGESYFKRGVHPSVDAAQDELDMSLAMFHSAASALNDAIGSDHVKVDTESGGMIGLTVTAKRWNAAVASGVVSNAKVEPWFVGSDATLGGPVSGKKEGGVRRLEHPALGSAASERIHRARAALEDELREKTLELLAELDDAHSDAVYSTVKEIDDLDVAMTCARNARDMGHVRPALLGGGTNSFVRARGLRHPIIESIMLDRAERYVSNDISLGGSSSSMLLYGVNAVGKSSLMKSVGLAVFMAQAGMYVAAESMELCPYHEIYTRVGLRDDLTRGHSTFVVEMLELRAILRQSGNRSLVIGDELCAGTESQSALAIVGSAIFQLANKGSSFVFATHLHELVDLPIVKDHLIATDKVRTFHLSVRFVEGKGKLVMDRKLSPGTGPPTYGLEVCRSLDMDPEFLERADEIRRHHSNGGHGGPLVTPRRSRYNAKLVMDTCGLCGQHATETHHLEPQATAKPHIKNRRHNLVPLCEKCHHDAHAGKIKIEGYQTTSDGVELLVTNDFM